MMLKVNFVMAAIGSFATYAAAEHMPNDEFNYRADGVKKNPCHEKATKDECYACCSPYNSATNPNGQVSPGALVARERSMAHCPSKQAYVVMPMTCLLVELQRSHKNTPASYALATARRRSY